MIDQKLKELHGVLAQELLKRVKDPEAKASDLNVARQFLKDNGIEAIPVDNSPLKALVDELPFDTEEDLVLHGKNIPTKLKDFRNFLYLVWKHLALPRPTPIQYDIANYLQSKDKRLIINAFRGVGKSWITSAYVCHQLLLNPQLNILVVSASKNRADDFSTFTLRLINEIDVLAHLKT